MRVVEVDARPGSRSARGRDGARETVEIGLVARSRPATRCSCTRAPRSARPRGRRRREVRRRVPRPRARPRARRRDPRARRAGPPLQGDGGLRRPHALDLQVRRRRPAARERRAGARARVPGLRDPDGARGRRHRDRPRARRDLHLLRRHDARAGLDGHAARREGRGRRRAHGLLAARRAAHRQGRTPTARSSSSRSASRPPRRRPR